jgi:hypothetical protein
VTAEAIAEALEAGVAHAREHQVNVERADELALRLAAHEAGCPMGHPLVDLFLRQYEGPADADHVAAAWHRQVLDREPPADVTERLAERERDARLERYRQALQEETERMPDYDVNEIARLLSEGKSMTEIATALDGPVADETAAENRRQLQEARGRLNSDAAGPGEMPDVDPVARAFRAADESGFQRGSDQRMQTFVEHIFEAAQSGDPRVAHEGVMTDEVRRRWHEDAHRRQIANRDASGMRRR